MQVEKKRNDYKDEIAFQMRIQHNNGVSEKTYGTNEHFLMSVDNDVCTTHSPMTHFPVKSLAMKGWWQAYVSDKLSFTRLEAG